MEAVWFRTISELRRRWRAWVALAVLAGIGGGIAIAAFAGARRTNTTLDRFVAGGAAPPDATIDPAPADLSGFAHVVRTAKITIVGLAPPAPAGSKLAAPDSIMSTVFDDPDRPFLGGVIIVDGRLPDVHVADEVAIDESAARHRGWKAGDRLTFAFRPKRSEESQATPPPRRMSRPSISPSPASYACRRISSPSVRVSSRRRSDPPTTSGSPQVPRPISRLRGVLDRRGLARAWKADLKAFTEEVRSASGGKASLGPPSQEDADVVADSTRAIHVQANALRIAAALMAIAVLFAAALAVSRQLRAGAEEWSTLRTLGMTPGQQVGVGFASGAAVAVVAALVAVVTAIALSSRFPFGFARRAEVDLGLRVDGPVLVTGALVLAVILSAWSAFAARRLVGSGSPLAGTRPPRRSSTSRLVRSISRAGAPPTAAVGVGMALDSRGSGGAVPVRTSLATMTAVVAAVVGTLVFATSLDHLIATPSLQGWRWDVVLTGDAPKLGEQLSNDRAATALARGEFAAIQIDGHDVAALALSPILGGGFEQIVDGRAPSRVREIALGAKTMHVLGVSIGDRLVVGGGESPRRMLVVGRAVMPAALGYPGMALSDGALLTGLGLEDLGFEETDVPFVAARFTPGTDIHAHTAKLGAADVIAESPRSAEVEDLRRVAGIRVSLPRSSA